MGPTAPIAAHTANASSGTDAIRIGRTTQTASASCASTAAALIRKGREAGPTTARGAPRNDGVPRRQATNAAPASIASKTEHTSRTMRGRSFGGAGVTVSCSSGGQGIGHAPAFDDLFRNTFDAPRYGSGT